MPQFSRDRFRLDYVDPVRIIRATDPFHEYPNCDRDLLPPWSIGRVTLLGDVAQGLGECSYPLKLDRLRQVFSALRIRLGIGAEAMKASTFSYAQNVFILNRVTMERTAIGVRLHLPEATIAHWTAVTEAISWSRLLLERVLQEINLTSLFISYR